MRAARLAAVTFLLLPGVGVTAEAEPQGVGPADKRAYVRNVAESFTCLDGSKSIALSSLNDDFCDCADGSDEPGTAACAGADYGRAAEVLFYCENRGARPRYVYRSHVQDGICDCCDGSDESRPSGTSAVAGRAESCPNFCDEESRPHRERREAILADWQRALDLQKNLSEVTELNLSQLQDELDKLNMEMDSKRDAMKHTQAELFKEERSLKELEYWEEYYNLEKIRYEEGEDAVAIALRTSKHFGPDSLKDGAATTTTTQMLGVPEELREVFMDWKTTEDHVVLSRRRQKDLEASLDAQILKEHPSLAMLAGQCVSLDVEDENDESLTISNEVCFFRDASMYILKQAPAEEDGSSGPATILCSLKDSQICASARRSGGGSNRSLISECDSLQRMLDCVVDLNCCGDSGSGTAQALQQQIEGQFSKKCPGIRNPCARTLLGRWKGWSFHGQKAPHAEFESGDTCKNDPGRNNEAIVKFVCGAKVRLKALSEVSPCRFEASVIHPAACLPALAPKESGPRLDKFMANVAVKMELESEAESKIEDWQRNRTYFESEVTRLMNETTGKKDAYENKQKEKEMRTHVSEYAKWMDADIEETTTTTTTTDYLADRGDKNDFIRQKIREYKIKKPQAEKEFWDAKWRSKGLEVILRDDLGGLRRAFADLENKCLEMQASDYDYQVCFYRQARRNGTDDKGEHQETNLGRFAHWDFSGSLPTAKFIRGDHCEGRQHETEVTFRCSAQLEVLSVKTEKGECTTKMEAAHPAGCDASSPPELPEIPSAPIRPRDEL